MRTLLAILVALVLCPPAAAYTSHDFNGSKTLLVGDSHTWIAVNFLSGLYPAWDIDAQPSRTSTGGLEVIDAYLRPRHQRVIFDLATNDYAQPTKLRANLRALWQDLGDRTLALVTSYRRDGNEIGPVNRVLRRFADNRRRATLVNWRAEAKQHPSYLSADLIHFTPEGYKRRVQIIRNQGGPFGR